MIKRILPLCGLLISIVSCSTDNSIDSNEVTKQTIHLDADWMVGEWMYEDEDGRLHEDWFRKNDTTLIGYSYYVQNQNDTVFFEEIQINSSGDSIFFKSLTEEKKFTNTKIYSTIASDQQRFSFVNQRQAFPREIKYVSMNDTLMMIEVSGTVDEVEETQPYQMIKQNRR